VRCLRQDLLSKEKHLLLERTTLTENYIAVATVPHAGSAMTCHHFDHKSSPSVKVMDRLTEAVEVAAKAADEEDVEDAADVEVEVRLPERKTKIGGAPSGK
jgi:hypothetical protein